MRSFATESLQKIWKKFNRFFRVRSTTCVILECFKALLTRIKFFCSFNNVSVYPTLSNVKIRCCVGFDITLYLLQASHGKLFIIWWNKFSSPHQTIAAVTSYPFWRKCKVAITLDHECMTYRNSRELCVFLYLFVFVCAVCARNCSNKHF